MHKAPWGARPGAKQYTIPAIAAVRAPRHWDAEGAYHVIR